MGCLTAPFKLVGCLGLLVLLGLGWLYRDHLEREVRRRIGPSSEAAAVESAGRPGTRALGRARSKVDSLAGLRADSVVLTPAEVASLVASGLDPTLRKQLDSLRVRLLHDEVALQARLRTGRLPRDALGPLTVALRDTEPIEAVGPLRVTGPGQGEWEVRSLRLRDFPLPADVVPGFFARALGRERGEGRATVPVRLPRGIADVRVRPTGATLYGVPRS